MTRKNVVPNEMMTAAAKSMLDELVRVEAALRPLALGVDRKRRRARNGDRGLTVSEVFAQWR